MPSAPTTPRSCARSSGVHDDRLAEPSWPRWPIPPATPGIRRQKILTGRFVAKRTTTPAGTLSRAYPHDGDQVVEEYASAPGQTGVLLARRHRWGCWIDDLVAEEIDIDGDGTLETTLHLDGLRGRTGSAIFVFETTFALTDSHAYAVCQGTPRFPQPEAPRFPHDVSP
ncbi:MAG TPA: hypothetical protein P5234_12205 [Thermoanaerobaculaceae bacterium]|nr:hypothetical protein [Thermoanaerobaculaceae bacterium]HRS16994.1 hypothetical protein [Thermoanaerobaculaceae bacterium]